MSLFCLSHNLVYLLYFCPRLDRSTIDKQGCGLTRKEYGNAVNIAVKDRILLKHLLYHAVMTSQVTAKQLVLDNL